MSGGVWNREASDFRNLISMQMLSPSKYSKLCKTAANQDILHSNSNWNYY